MNRSARAMMELGRHLPISMRIAALPLATCTALFLSADFGQQPAAGQPESVCTDGAVPIASGPGSEGEPSVKAFQRHEGRMVAVWTSGQAVSPGAGLSPVWGRVELAQRTPSGSWVPEVLAPENAGDPWLDTAPDGSAYVSYMVPTADSPWSVVSVRRVRPGEPAGPPRQAPPYMGDHPALAVDQRTEASTKLYLVSLGLPLGPGLLTTSEDGGRTWRDRMRFPGPGGEFAPVIGSGGETIVAAWVAPGIDGYAVRAASIDPETDEFRAAMTLTDATRGGGGFGAHALPSVAVVRDGPLEGRAYVVWPQSRREVGRGARVYFSYSDDAGATWSTARRLVGRAPEGSVQVYPSVAARPDGGAEVVWMDSRDDPSNESALMYRATIRTDGSRTPATPLTSCPTYDEEGDAALGDYFVFDASQGMAVAFPNIRVEGGDSDVFFIEE